MDFLYVVDNDDMIKNLDLSNPGSFRMKKIALECPSNIVIFCYQVASSGFCTIYMRYEYDGEWHETNVLLSPESLYHKPPEVVNQIVIDLLLHRIRLAHPIDHRVLQHTGGKIREILTSGAAVEYDKFILAAGATDSTKISHASKKLPGMGFIADFPCVCPRTPVSLWNIVQHLNDKHKDWTRERIADWLDALHDSGRVNLEFEPWEAQDMES